MSLYVPQSDGSDAAMQLHLLGTVAFEDCLALQRRLVYEANGRCDGRIDVLLCEHPPLITVGRAGSRGHVRLSGEQLRRRQLPLRWVARGGGCVFHSTGQLAVYPIVPLWWHRWTVGDYLRRFQAAIAGALDELQFRVETQPGHFGFWGRSGQLVAMGAAVRDWTTLHGAFINVNPAMSVYGFVDSTPADSVSRGTKTTMGCLLAERRQPVKMASMRAALIPHLAEQFQCGRYFMHTGHPWLRSRCPVAHEPANRAS